jgi:hypothetical protein
VLSHSDLEVSHRSGGNMHRENRSSGKRGVKSDSAGCKLSTCETSSSAMGSRYVKSRAAAECSPTPLDSRSWPSGTRRCRRGLTGRETHAPITDGY